MKRFFVTAAAIIAVSTASIAANLKAEKYALSDGEQQMIRDAVKAALRDPDSAKFADIVAAQNEKGLITICGDVNAKNGYGGYTGMEHFYILGGQQKGQFDLVSVGLRVLNDGWKRGLPCLAVVQANQ